MSKGNTTSSSASETLKKRSLILALVIVLAGIIVGGLWMRKHEPNYYAPGRRPLW